MMVVRRSAIVGIVALALVWALMLSPRSSLASIGLVAFAAMAQFTPHFVLGIFGKDRDPVAGRASLAAGFALWLWTLAMPQVLPEAWMTALAGTLADPLRLLGIGHASPLVHGVLWSMAANLIVLVAGTAGRDPGSRLPIMLRGARPVRNIGELADLVGRFTGEERAEEEFPVYRRALPVDRLTARRAQDLIAGVVSLVGAHARRRAGRRADEHRGRGAAA
jgi:hypothetical protein